MTDFTPREFILRLRGPMHDDPKLELRRLRAIMKRLGRTYHFHTVECRPVKQTKEK